MSLLLLFAFPNPLSVPVSTLVATAPSPSDGVITSRPAVDGEWRFVLELADPADGDSAIWRDISNYYAGDRYQRGADDYLGKYRASIATVQLQIDNSDMLAPWGQDTSSLFGIDVRLDAGMLMRFSMSRVVSGVVVEWAPIWTGRVESWGDETEARGQIRKHVVTVVDTIADLANVPTQIINNVIYWPEWLTENLARANWLFGVDFYGDQTSLAYLQDLDLVPAINRMDSGTEPAGLVWRTLRSGRIVVHPAPWDTTNVERYDNPLLAAYPDGLRFSYFPDTTDIEYIQDDGQPSFGAPRNNAGILNSFFVTMPGDFGPEVYVTDDPVSAGRYGTRPYQATWISNNPPAVDDMLAARAYSSSQALPLRTSLNLEGFWSAMTLIDQFDPVTVVHASRDDGLVLTATGTVRNIVEERTYQGDGGLAWQSTVQIDIDATDTAPALLPVENLALVATETPGLGGPSLAEFSWTNPVQPDITPTEVQIRVLGRSLIWFGEDYPGVGADGTVIGFLSAATHYTLQVRLIRRVNGVIVAFSASRQVAFTTPANILPVPVPGTDPTDTDVDMPPFDDECEDVSIELQENDGSGWVTVDTFDGAEIEQDDTGNWHLVDDIPNSFFNAGSMYRWRGLCDGDVIVTGDPFDPPDDWDDPCTTPPALSDPPFDAENLLVYVPQICAPDIIREYVSGIAGVHGDALLEIGALLGGDPDQRVLVALADPAWSTTPGGILAYGECPQITGQVADKTLTIRTRISDAAFCVLGECSAMRLTVTPDAGGWKAGAYVAAVGGEQVCLSGVLALDTIYTLTAVYVASTGTLELSVDGSPVNSVSFGEARNTVNALPIWRVGAPPESWVTDFALWPGVPVPPPTPIPGGAVHWWDFSNASTVTGAISTVADQIGTSTFTASGPGAVAPITSLGSNGLTAARCQPAGSALERMTATGLGTTAQPFGISWVGRMPGSGYWFMFQTPLVYGPGSTWTSQAGVLFDIGTRDSAAHVFYVEYNGGSTKAYVDGVLTFSGNGGSGSFAPFDPSSLFNQPTGGQVASSPLDIGELVVIAGTLTGPQIAAEHTRLATKWGV